MTTEHLCHCSFCVGMYPASKYMIRGPIGRTACDGQVRRASDLQRLLCRVPEVEIRDLGPVEQDAIPRRIGDAHLSMQIRLAHERVVHVYVHQDGKRTLLTTTVEPPPPEARPDATETCAFCFGNAGKDRLFRYYDEAVMCAACVATAQKVIESAR